MGNVLLRVIEKHSSKHDSTDHDSLDHGHYGVSAQAGVGVSALVKDLLHFEDTSEVPEGLNEHVKSSIKAQANWYTKLLQALMEEKTAPKTPEEASRLIIHTLKGHQKADVNGLLEFYGLPPAHALVDQQTTEVVSSSLSDGVKFELHSLPVDAKAVADGDTVTVYVSVSDPREASFLPQAVKDAAAQRTKARAQKNYTKADALHKQIIGHNYRMIDVQNEEVLAKKYRIRLRGIDSPESKMPYGSEAKQELLKLVEGKCLRVLVYGEDRYGRCVGDIYCDGIFAQEKMLKKGLAWHYAAYDHRAELVNWEKGARAKRVGLWASPNPEEPWNYRKNKRQGK